MQTKSKIAKFTGDRKIVEIPKKDRDKFEHKNAQETFSRKLKELGVFVNGNGLYHFSMSHTSVVVKELINIIKRVSY